ncbi:adenosylcobinamide-GDP ribazoletransferase [Paenibacillus anaericanus]|uniref:adenosylcobinamide-GDP ribazoletransferase n=1 Tax=Paenibacillus anaericanus TaxID=170367 RepID=UPI00277E23BE|nr:adenosylcobinamide-GDP ribazoletransferase [Paenibacillus anaericanus]MDQ0087242.1 adenosylcobinamide-GDP ribazoletransferase [Paenibacillus anaericanus]
MSDKSRPILAAFQFLSRIPIKVELDFTPALLRRSVKYYPLVGAVIGLVVWAGGTLSAWALPSLPAAVITLILWVWMTGGLHLDGWMDSADALLSYRSREKMLEIMKDSRVGAMGVLACVLLLLFKVSLIASLLELGALPAFMALLVAPIWSRWFMGWAMRSWPMAREGEGLAGRFHGLSLRDIILSTILAITLSASGLFLASFTAWNEVPWMRLVLYFVLLPLVTYGVGTLSARVMSSKLGGLTGDTYGALNEGLEVVLLLLAVLIIR